jgi:hypothetical protein
MLSACLQSIARCSGTQRARAKLTNNNAQYIGIFQAHASALAVNFATFYSVCCHQHRLPAEHGTSAQQSMQKTEQSYRVQFIRHFGIVDTRPRIKAKKAMDHTRVHQALRGDCIMRYGCPYAGLGLHEAVASCVTGCQGVCTALKP